MGFQGGRVSSGVAGASVPTVGIVGSLGLAPRLAARAQGKTASSPVPTPYGSVDVLTGVIGGGRFAAVAKSGVAPDSTELEQILTGAPRWRSLSIRGLMTVPPYPEDPENARSFFRQLREIQDQISSRKLLAIEMDVLSMGMSHDFEVAIEEGSTCVRVGTAIFGERTNA